MTILVTGATGTIGRQVVGQLVERGQRVRALTRDPIDARLPASVEIVVGDLTAPDTLGPALDGVTALHLISLAGDDYAPLLTAGDVIDRATAAGVRRLTVLTGTEEELVVAQAVEASSVDWTHIRPVEFMANKLEWAASIRDEGVVRAPFATQPGALVHEADVAAVVIASLLEDGHSGQTYTPMGPETLTPTEAARTIGDVIGRNVSCIELTADQAREQMRAGGILDDVIDYVIEYGTNPPASASMVLRTVEEVTGRPARSFAQWAVEHADAFRRPRGSAAATGNGWS